MWMSAPTPVTSRSIVLLKSSRTSPSGMERTGRRSIQVNSTGSRFGVANTMQLPAKQASTAVTEMKLLMRGALRVTSAIVTAAMNGRSRIYQGSALNIILEFQGVDIFDVGGLAGAEQRHNDGEAHRNFSGCDCDDEKDKDLCVVVGTAVGPDLETGEGDQRKIGSV